MATSYRIARSHVHKNSRGTKGQASVGSGKEEMDRGWGPPGCDFAEVVLVGVASRSVCVTSCGPFRLGRSFSPYHHVSGTTEVRRASASTARGRSKTTDRVQGRGGVQSMERASWTKPGPCHERCLSSQDPGDSCRPAELMGAAPLFI